MSKITSVISHHQGTGVIFNLTNISLVVVTALQIFGDELFRFMPFILVVYFVYKSTQNRKHAVLLGTIVFLVIFGVLYTSAYGSFLFALIGITISAISLAYAYLKTKNIVVSFIVHLIVDFSILIIFNLASIMHVVA